MADATILRNVWYVAALSEEVDRTPLGRTIATVPIVFYRREDGGVVAISGICPHRFAPLDRGRVIGDTIECGYHGLRFGPDGRCLFNPQSEIIVPASHLRDFPVEERYGLAWVWVGEREKADPASIPDLSPMANDAHRRTVFSYLLVTYRHDILIDNLLDLSHIDYLHVGSFSAGSPKRHATKVEQIGDRVIVTRTLFEAPAEPMSADIAPVVDKWFEITWTPSQTVLFDSLTVEAGKPLETGRPSVFGHIATPCDAGSTHYYMFVSRQDRLDDAALDALISSRQKEVIEKEDSPMLQLINDHMDGRDLLDMRPLVLPDDAGALRARRIMKRLLAAT